MEISKYKKVFGVGPLGVLATLIVLILLWLVDRYFDHVQVLNHPQRVRAVGVIIIGIWICWHIWAIKTVSAWWRGDCLCTAGPFHLVRHPMYAGGIFLADIGIALLFNSWIVLLLPILVYPIWSILVRKEEEMMKAVFGKEYARYAAATGRFIPKIFRKQAGALEPRIRS